LWCIIGPQEISRLDPKDVVYLDEYGLQVRGSTYRGKLYRMPVTFNNESGEGTDVTVEATVFVPTLREHEEWLHPNFIGLDGALHRLRFAVDPAENAFYFGAITD